MTQMTLMAHLELGRSNAGLLRVAGDLAVQCDAAVIGIAACQPFQMIYGDAYVPGDVIEQGRDELEAELHAAEAEFRAALAPRAATIEWRSTLTMTSLAGYMAQQSRSADLFISGVDRNNSIFDTSRHVDTGELVMTLGRPILVVPDATDRLDLTHAVLAWKDTRETRRAASDALPLLRRAGQVTVVEITEKDDLAAAQADLRDVQGWLRRHGISANCHAAVAQGDNAEQLAGIAGDIKAGLIVAGAYGHSRLRELVLGGVTRDLLLRADRCALVSH